MKAKLHVRLLFWFICCISASLRQLEGGGNVTFDITMARSRGLSSVYTLELVLAENRTCRIWSRCMFSYAGDASATCSVVLQKPSRVGTNCAAPTKNIHFHSNLNHCDWYLDRVETFITDLWSQINLYGLFYIPTVSTEVQFEYIKYQMSWRWLTSGVLITSSATGVEHQAAQMLP